MEVAVIGYPALFIKLEWPARSGNIISALVASKNSEQAAV